ncbi:transcriptional regulator, LysR family [Selenomonas sp. WCT3]|nr:transcriptional regulator, LysR family [Selenomonas ruminantium]
MELRVLNYFLTVAREGNFSRAAEKLHLSQPTLSRQIKDMEDEYGKTLLIREPRRVLLTEDGELLRRRAEEILSLVEKTEGELLSNDRSISGDIRIGAGESVNFRLVMQVAKEIRNTYPDIRFHIISGDGETTLHRLDRGLIDFGYVYGDLDPAKYHQLSLPARDRWVVLMNNQDELAQNETISPTDLHNQPLLISRQTLSPSTHGDELLNWLGKPLEELHIAGSYTLLYNASLMVREGLGCVLAFENIINTKGSDICCRPLKPEIFAQPFIAWKKNQVFSKASQKFLEALKNRFL